jgi:WD40 repeat protein
MGQRFAGLEMLSEAAEIARDLGTLPPQALNLRNEAVACLALADMRVAREWDGWPTGSMTVDFDGPLERYARVDRQGVVHLHRVADGAEIAQMKGWGPGNFGGGETKPTFSPDGRFLLLVRGLKVQQVRMWMVQPGQKPALVPLKAPPCLACAFSPDSREVILAPADGSIRIHDLPTGRERTRVQVNVACRHLAYHPRARQVAIGHVAGVQVCDLETGDIVADLPQATDGYCAWHPDGKTLAIFGNDRIVHLWDVARRRPGLRLRNASAPFAFNHAGSLLASTGWDGVLRLWDTRTGNELFTTRTVAPCLRFSTDDERLAAGIDAGNGKLRLWQVASPLAYRTLAREPAFEKEGYGDCTVSSRESLLAVGTRSGVGLWDLDGGAQVGFLEIGWSGCVFEPDGALITWDALPGQSLRWPIRRDMGNPGLLRIGPPERLPFDWGAVAISRDGNVLAVGGSRFRDSRGLVWHRNLPGPPLQLPFHVDPRSIDISPDGRWVATGSHWGTKVNISDARTAELIHELPIDESSRVRFSPDNRWLATSGGGCRLWAVDSWREGPFLGGNNVAFSPSLGDSRSEIVALETGQGTIRLVDVDAAREYARLDDGSQARADRGCFTPDGAELVLTGESAAIQVWDLRRIRDELARLGLDWELSAYPPNKPRAPAVLQVQIELGDALSRKIAGAKNAEAWSLATSADTKAQDPHRAIELAREAIALVPENGGFWNCLGVAHYRARHWEESIRALNQSMSLRSGQFESFNTFFLAMAHWQRKDTEEARKRYDQAVAWLQKHGANLLVEQQELLRRFDEEAATLLELPNRKK